MNKHKNHRHSWKFLASKEELNCNISWCKKCGAIAEVEWGIVKYKTLILPELQSPDQKFDRTICAVEDKEA